MIPTSSVSFTVVCFMVIVLVFLSWCAVASAAEYMEEFDEDLDPNIWEIKAEGDASYRIEDGQLIMTSPGVEDGILMYWRGSDIEKEDLIVEIQATVFWCGTLTPGWYINDDTWSRSGAQGPEFEAYHVVGHRPGVANALERSPWNGGSC